MATLPSGLGPLPVIIQSSSAPAPQIQSTPQTPSPPPQIVQASPAQRVHLGAPENKRKSTTLLWLAITLVPLTLIALMAAFYATRRLLDGACTETARGASACDLGKPERGATRDRRSVQCSDVDRDHDSASFEQHHPKRERFRNGQSRSSRGRLAQHVLGHRHHGEEDA
jgi:hypothetical protein